MTKSEEKAEVLHAYFASVFNHKTSCSLGAQPPELEDRDREQLSHHPWRYLKDAALRDRFSGGLVSARLMVGLSDLKGLLQPQ